MSRPTSRPTQGRPAGLTLAEFVNVLRTGRDPDDPDELLQVMPWPVFQDMRYDDMQGDLHLPPGDPLGVPDTRSVRPRPGS